MRRLLIIPAMSLLTACASVQVAESPAAQKPEVTEPTFADLYAMEECTGELDHGTWTLSCPQFVVSRTLIDRDPSWTEKLILNTTLATLREGAETVGTTSDRRPSPNLNVAGGHGYAMKIETGTADATQLFGMTTYARPLSDQQVIGVICMDLEQTTAERCEDVALRFATELPEIEWRDVSVPTQFAGRLIQAPPGCEVDGDSTVVCGTGAELLWFESHEGDPPRAHLDELDVVARAIVRVNRERTGLNPTPTEQGFDCRLDGELADCTIYRYEYATNALYVVVGQGTVRGVNIGVLCDWTSDLTDEIPMPCSLIVDPTVPDTLTKEL